MRELRSISPELANLKLKNIRLSKNGSAAFDFICDKAVSFDLKNAIIAKLKGIIPSFFGNVTVNVTKIVADGELVAKEIISYLLSSHMSVAHAVGLSDVAFSTFDGVNSNFF